MSYTALRFDAASNLADAWSDALIEAGALSADLSDSLAETDGETPLFGEPDPSGVVQPANQPTVIWEHARITALFPAGTDADALRALLAEIATALGQSVPLFETYPVAERDWVRETQAQFPAIPITDTFWIVPTWVEPPTAAQHVLRLDPGLAFGTGSHPTTRLCLRWLAEHPPKNAAVLDYGCGSGILLLGALLLGASADDAYGVDIDPQALIASCDNAAQNFLRAHFVSSDQLPENTTFDLTVANILANPLMLLAPLLAARTRVGGTILLSGILASQREEVLTRYHEWFDMHPEQEEEGWVLLVGTRRPEVS